MHLNSDQPISGILEDKLGRAHFAESLAQMICSIKQPESITIGMHGRWGSGKTSVINMILEAIQKQTKDSPETAPIIVRFEPWDYVDDHQLMQQFFKVLIDKLMLKDDNEKMRKAGEALSSYAKIAGTFEFIPTVGPILKVLTSFLEQAGDAIVAETQTDDNLSIWKEKACDALREMNNKLIVVIDDIDRLTNSQIRMIVQLVNSIAKFPNTIYLLSFDRDIVCRALKKMQRCNGEEYLEKIIQFPINLPEARKQDVEKVLFDKLEKLLEQTPSFLFSQMRWRRLYPTCIAPFISTIRDVNRFMNTFSMLHQTLFERIDFVDLAIVAALQVWEPNLYAWIVENARELCGSVYYPTFAEHEDTDAAKERMLSTLTAAVGPTELSLAINVVKGLFPKGLRLFENYYSNERSDVLFAHGRVADSRCFELAFCMPTSAFTHTMQASHTILHEMSPDNINETLRLLAIDNSLDEFLSYLIGWQGDIPIERYPNIIEAMLRVLGKTPEAPSAGLINITTDNRLVATIESLLHDLSDEESVALFERVLPALDIDNLMAFAEFLNDQELEHKRYGDQQQITSNLAISSACLDMVERIFCEQMEHYSHQTNLYERSDSSFALFVWEKLDKVKSDEYKTEAYFTSDLALAMSITRRAGRSERSDYSSELSWAFENSIARSEERPAIIDAINRLRFTDKFWNLALQDQEKIATYYLIDTDDDKMSKSVPIDVARKLLVQWKAEYEELICQ